MSTPGSALASTPRPVDRDAVLRALNLNPADPNTVALLLICDRYGLDPLLKHVVLIQGRPYVTRDGYLHVAHNSGALDGIEILDEGDDGTHWWARVAVHRKDMTRPFVYRGRHPKGGGNRQYGPEMAVKCAEVAALRRAFNVTGAGAAEERWEVDEPAGIAAEVLPAGWADRDEMRDAHHALSEQVARLGDDARARLNDWRTEAGIAGWPLDRESFDLVLEHTLALVDDQDSVDEEPF